MKLSRCLWIACFFVGKYKYNEKQIEEYIDLKQILKNLYLGETVWDMTLIMANNSGFYFALSNVSRDLIRQNEAYNKSLGETMYSKVQTLKNFRSFW